MHPPFQLPTNRHDNQRNPILLIYLPKGCRGRKPLAIIKRYSAGEQGEFQLICPVESVGDCLRYQQYRKSLNCYYLYLFAWRFATSKISHTSPTEEGGAGRLDWSDNGDGLWQLLSRRAPITKAKFLKGIGESGV